MTTPALRTILIADDEPLIAHDIARTLRTSGFETASVVTNPARFVHHVERDRPALAVVDIRFGLQDGIDLVSTLAEEIRPRVLYVSGCTDAPTVSRAALTSCVGFVTKPFSDEQLVAAVRLALAAPPPRPPAAADAERAREILAQIAGLVSGANGRPRQAEPSVEAVLPELSAREREVVAMMVRHGRVARVAEALHLSTHTVRNHLKTIYQKLDVHSLDELFDRFHGAEARAHRPVPPS
jgi:two-component system response regulator FixJ